MSSGGHRRRPFGPAAQHHSAVQSNEWQSACGHSCLPPPTRPGGDCGRGAVVLTGGRAVRGGLEVREFRALEPVPGPERLRNCCSPRRRPSPCTVSSRGLSGGPRRGRDDRGDHDEGGRRHGEGRTGGAAAAAAADLASEWLSEAISSLLYQAATGHAGPAPSTGRQQQQRAPNAAARYTDSGCALAVCSIRRQVPLH